MQVLRNIVWGWAALLAASSSLAWGQGHSCYYPEPIAGLGSFPFDTTTTGSTNFGWGTACNSFAFGTAFEGFFAWTATGSGEIRFEVDDPTGDLRIALFEGITCDATCLAAGVWGAGPSGPVRQVTLSQVLAGEQYLIVIANSTGLPGSGAGAIGDLRIDWGPCDPSQMVIDGFEDNDSCATATPLNAGIYPGLFASDTDPDFYRFVLPGRHEATLWVHSQDNVRGIEVPPDCQLSLGYFIQQTWFNETLEPTEILVVAQPNQFAQCGFYDLELAIEEGACAVDPATAMAFEPNDTCTTPALIGLGYHSGLWTDAELDSDYYTVIVPPLQSVRVNLFGDPGAYLMRSYGSCYQGPGVTGPSAPPSDWLLIHNDSEEPLAQDFTIFFGGFPNPTGCTVYDLSLTAAPNPCLRSAPDVFHEYSALHAIGNGEFDGLSLYPDKRFRFCVESGDVLDLELALQQPTGFIDATLRCVSDNDCQNPGGGVLASGSGQSLTLQWQNTTPQAVRVLLEAEFLGSSVPCNLFDLKVTGSGFCENTGYDYTLHADQFCAPGEVHSGGEATLLMASTDGYGLWLDGLHGPPGGFGFLLASTQTAAGVPFASGRLCLDLSSASLWGRYNRMPLGMQPVGEFDYQGRFGRPGPRSITTRRWGYALPHMTPWGSYTWEHDVLHFQLWYRDPSGGSNLSSGISVYL